ncbi:hypothetical protein J2X37_002869 [Croceicoccus sp. BE223]|nr:hypothetical protein [Croceicoccus sp. BE223]
MRHDDILDPFGIDAGAIDDAADDVGGELFRLDRRQRAEKAADRCPQR